MSKIVLRYGLMAGLAICAVILGPFFLFGPQPEYMEIGEIVGYTGMVLSMSAIFFAVRQRRNEQATLAFGEAFFTGICVTLVAAFLFGIGTAILYAIAGDSLPQALIDFYAHQIRQSGADAATMAAKLAELEGQRAFFFNRPLQVALMFSTVVLIGAPLSLIAAWVFRKPAIEAARPLASPAA